MSWWSSTYDARPDSNRLGFDPCYIWWSMWSLSSKRMRTCFLLGGVTVTAISVLGSPVIVKLAQITRGWGKIPHWGTEFIWITGPVYTKHQSQCCDNSAITLVILLSLKTMELLQIGVATHFQASPLFSMRTELLAPSQNCCNVDADVWCKRP